MGLRVGTCFFPIEREDILEECVWLWSLCCSAHIAGLLVCLLCVRAWACSVPAL